MTAAYGFVFAATVTMMAAAVLALWRRRRSSRALAGGLHRLDTPLDPLPAGLKHLGATMRDLSTGLRLPPPPPGAGSRKRLGVLLGLR